MYYVELTDTFNGEANFAWVQKFFVNAKTAQGAISKVARDFGAGWRKQWSDGECSRYDLQKSCMCAFVTYKKTEDILASDCIGISTI